MSERLPYEERLPQLMDDLPLPDGDLAWADMKRRLDEDEDDGGFIFWWRRGCMLWGIALLALLVAIGWWYFKPQEKGSSGRTNSVVEEGKPVDEKQKSRQGNHDTDRSADAPGGNMQQDKGRASFTRSDDRHMVLPEAPPPRKEDNKGRDLGASSGGKGRGGYLLRSHTVGKNGETATQSPETLPDMLPVGRKSESISKPAGDSARSVDKGERRVSGIPEKGPVADTILHDSLPVDRVAAPDPVMKDTSDSTKKKPITPPEIFFTAGLGLNQQVPVAGQKAVPYGGQGRTWSVADYVPSVYFRLNKKGKWFIQAGFRYGAPQYNKPLVYAERTDTAGGVRLSTSKRLQKTYYHQLPVGLHYYILPEWSMGAGIVWNRFRKSVYEEVITDLNASSDSIVSKQVFSGTDPRSEGLSKSYFQGLLETQYQWKRFSFGARYNFGLQPYIRFTLPNEPERKERNQSLQIFIRYELLRLPGKGR